MKSVIASLLKIIFRRRHDEAIHRTMPWLVASGAIVPGSIYTTPDRRERR